MPTYAESMRALIQGYQPAPAGDPSGIIEAKQKEQYRKQQDQLAQQRITDVYNASYAMDEADKEKAANDELLKESKGKNVTTTNYGIYGGQTPEASPHPEIGEMRGNLKTVPIPNAKPMYAEEESQTVEPYKPELAHDSQDKLAEFLQKNPMAYGLAKTWRKGAETQLESSGLQKEFAVPESMKHSGAYQGTHYGVAQLATIQRPDGTRYKGFVNFSKTPNDPNYPNYMVDPTTGQNIPIPEGHTVIGAPRMPITIQGTGETATEQDVINRTPMPKTISKQPHKGAPIQESTPNTAPQRPQQGWPGGTPTSQNQTGVVDRLASFLMPQAEASEVPPNTNLRPSTSIEFPNRVTPPEATSPTQGWHPPMIAPVTPQEQPKEEPSPQYPSSEAPKSAASTLMFPKEAEDRAKLTQDFLAHDDYKLPSQAINKLGMLKAVLKDAKHNSIAVSHLGIDMAKFLGEVGNLSAADVTRYITPKTALANAIPIIIQEWGTGVLNPKFAGQLEELLPIYERAHLLQLHRSALERAIQFSGNWQHSRMGFTLQSPDQMRVHDAEIGKDTYESLLNPDIRSKINDVNKSGSLPAINYEQLNDPKNPEHDRALKVNFYNSLTPEQKLTLGMMSTEDKKRWINSGRKYFPFHF